MLAAPGRFPDNQLFWSPKPLARLHRTLPGRVARAMARLSSAPGRSSVGLVSLPGISFSSKETAIMREIKEAVGIVRETEQRLPDLVEAAARGDLSGCMEMRSGIFELEAKAAAAKKGLSTRIAEGAFFGGVREDMIDLLGNVEAIADKAKDAARLITLAEITDPNAREILRSDDMKRFLSKLDQTVAALQELLGAFQVDRKTILQRVAPVEDHEVEADVYKQKVLTALFDRTRGIDPVTVILVRDFVFSADDVADYAEHASDVVIVLVAKGYG